MAFSKKDTLIIDEFNKVDINKNKFPGQEKELKRYYNEYVLPVIKEIENKGIFNRFLYEYKDRLDYPILYYIKCKLTEYIKENYDLNKYNILIEVRNACQGYCYGYIEITTILKDKYKEKLYLKQIN